ncbi:MAG: type I-U CRISPR-associated protein Cas8c [Candidatus Binatia bacterium]|nr:MAG: type I-U CRISPR-associated protein Cas8c [Candidatus Binatia bacterium]
MSRSAPTLSVQVDITNPGQFFACCGLLEVAHRVWCPGPAEGWFADGHFLLARNDGKPAEMADLINAALGCDAQTIPIDDPKTDPIGLGDPIRMRLDWWRRSDGSTNLFKTWAANATSLQMYIKWRDPLRSCLGSINDQAKNLLLLSHQVQGSYGFDSDLVWDALCVGFSFNEHNKLRKLPTRPAVELFGAIGLERFFPELDEKKRSVSYSAWRVPLTASVARAAVLGLVPEVTLCRLRTHFVSRGSFKGLDTARVVEGGSYE